TSCSLFILVLMIRCFDLLKKTGSRLSSTQLEPEYVYVDKEMNWSSAQMYCRENFVDLATVSSDLQNRMVKELVPFGAYLWIGLFRFPNFFWSDGSSVLFSNWDDADNPINSMTMICGITSGDSNGRWRFLSCETKLPVDKEVRSN
uniref:C-type lectin domain-containing protein n=1 Tax=Xiphophorus maculatus TaxID=8083 RepID=A0A3B5QYK9_XIPMA